MKMSENSWDFEELVFNRANSSTVADFTITQTTVKKNGETSPKVKFSISPKIAEHFGMKKKSNIKISYSKNEKAYKIEKTNDLKSLTIYENNGKIKYFSSGWRAFPDGFEYDKNTGATTRRISDDRTMFNKNHVIVFMS